MPLTTAMQTDKENYPWKLRNPKPQKRSTMNRIKLESTQSGRKQYEILLRRDNNNKIIRSNNPLLLILDPNTHCRHLAVGELQLQVLTRSSVATL